MGFMNNFMPGEWDWQNGNPSITPIDDTTAQLMLKRRLAQADLLKGVEAPQGQMVSGHYVAPSWTQQLANLYSKYQGGQQEREAVKGYQDYLGQQKKTRQDALAAAIKKLGPQDITEQTTYDIQVPNGKQAGSTDNLGGMQPYESGMKTISVPMTKVTGTRQPSYEDALAALSGYATATNQPDLAEKLMMNKATSLMTPDSFDLHNIGDTAYLINKRTGKPVIGDNGQPIKYEGQQKPRNVQFEKVREGNQEVTYQINADGTRTKIATGNAFSPKETKPTIFDLPGAGGKNTLMNPPKARPLTNSKGWTLHTDANGNQAYVSPDGKQFEEAK